MKWDVITSMAEPGMVLITGNTYPVKDQLKVLGGRWDPNRGGWNVPSGRADEARRIVRGDAVGQQEMELPPATSWELPPWESIRVNVDQHDQQAWRETRERADKLERDLRGAREAIKNLEGQIRHLTRERDEARAKVKYPTVQPPIQAFKPTDSQLFIRILKQWYTSMSRIFHPDMGGTAEKQAVLNQCYNDLKKRLEESCRTNGQNKATPPWR